MSGKHQKEPGHQTRDNASPVDNVIPEGAGPCQAGGLRFLSRFPGRFTGMPDWPAGFPRGPGVPLFPGAADPGERPCGVKDRAGTRPAQPAPQASLTRRAAIR